MVSGFHVLSRIDSMWLLCRRTLHGFFCYLYSVALPDRSPHGERGWRPAANAVQQRQAGTRSHCMGHLTGEHREAAKGKAAWTHTQCTKTGQLLYKLRFTPSRCNWGDWADMLCTYSPPCLYSSHTSRCSIGSAGTQLQESSLPSLKIMRTLWSHQHV